MPRSMWLLLAAGIALITLSINVAFASELQKMQDEMLGASTQIGDNCSGTLIHSKREEATGVVTTYILTAKHCIDGANKEYAVDLPIYQKMRIVKEDRYYAKVKAQDYKADLAVLVLKDEQTWFDNAAAVASADINMMIGERVWTVGYPLGGPLTITDGMFGAAQTVNYPTDGIEYFRATPNATFGNSGGALYRKNEKGDYELVGVVTARMMDNTFMTLYTPISTIQDFLRRVDPDAFGGVKTSPASR